MNLSVMKKLNNKSGISIGFVLTNFNNSELTIQAIESIKNNSGSISCHSVIVDNASTEDQIKLLDKMDRIGSNIDIIYNKLNVGYFKGLNIGIEFLKKKNIETDYVVVGNNDLVFSTEFFVQLESNSELLDEYPVVSPDLITLDGVHQNPHVIGSISRFREIVWDIYFLNYWLSVIISLFSEISRGFFERKDYLAFDSPMLITQGYGACYILTKKFFSLYDRLWSPNFLMGEEFFLSKQLESDGFKFFYYPGLTVQHHDHATVSKISSKKMWLYSKQYHNIYRKFVSPYRKKMDNGHKYTDFFKVY